MSASSLQLIRRMEQNVIQPLTVASKKKEENPVNRKVIEESDYEEEEEEDEEEEDESTVTVQSTKSDFVSFFIQTLRFQSQRRRLQPAAARRSARASYRIRMHRFGRRRRRLLPAAQELPSAFSPGAEARRASHAGEEPFRRRRPGERMSRRGDFVQVQRAGQAASARRDLRDAAGRAGEDGGDAGVLARIGRTRRGNAEAAAIEAGSVGEKG